MIERKPKPEDKDIEFGRDVTVADTARPDATMQRDFIDAYGRTYLMITDELTLKMLWEDQKLRHLIPAFAGILRTSNIDKDEKALQDLDYEYAIMQNKMSMNEDEYEHYACGTHIALRIHARSVTNDQLGGWKAKVATEQTKHIITETRKKKGLL